MAGIFEPTLIQFLTQLKQNNTKQWFHEHKQDYEARVREPALRFIQQMEPYLKMISPYYEAQAKKVGGSLMRVHRDVRFSNDKSPYKTNVGIQFRHELGKDVHAPGFYCHIAPGDSFLGVGVWHPEPKALSAIRDAIVENPEQYQAAIDHGPFKKHFSLEGSRLIRPPKGFSKDHPLIEELKRKDFIALCPLDDSELFKKDFCKKAAQMYARAQPLQKFLCNALELRF